MAARQTNAKTGGRGGSSLADLRTGQRCILDRLDLPDDIARRLMELGFLPGSEVELGRRSPGGGARVFRVDGSEIALRDETAARLYLRRHPDSDLVVLPSEAHKPPGAAPNKRVVSADLAASGESVVRSSSK